MVQLSDEQPERCAPGVVSEYLGWLVSVWSQRWLGWGVEQAGKRSILNFLGQAIVSARTPTVDAAIRVLSPVSGGDRVTVIGRTQRLDLYSAVFVNAVSGNLLDYDDTHWSTVIHPSAPVLPPVLAIAELFGLSGATVLQAFILGVEVECRIGRAVSPRHYARGWHITSTCGIFGSAAAAAMLLGLNAAQAAHALGLAASQSAGIVANLSTEAKNVGVGNSARNGLFAALLAKQGYKAAPKAIEGMLGWAQAMGDDPELSEVFGGWGERWDILENTYKPYPCGVVLHAVIDACLAIRDSHGITKDKISKVTVYGNQLLLDRGNRHVSNAQDARVSIHHCVAVAFLYGAAGLREFSDEVVHRLAVAELRQRIDVALDPTQPIYAARVEVETNNGELLSAAVADPKGSLRSPLTDHEVEAKARDMAYHGTYHGDIEKVIELVWNLEALDTIEELSRLLGTG